MQIEGFTQIDELYIDKERSWSCLTASLRGGLTTGISIMSLMMFIVAMLLEQIGIDMYKLNQVQKIFENWSVHLRCMTTPIYL